MRIEKGDKMVQMLSASALGKADADANKTINEFGAQLMSNFTPDNRYQMAQLIKFSVENTINERTGYFDSIAEYKSIGDNDEALFDTEFDNSFAVIQADGASTPRWEVGTKTVTLTTAEVSSRFRVNRYDMRSGKVDLGRMTQRATARMEEQMAAKIMDTLNASYNGTAIATPFYGSGSGVVAATLDPMIRHFQRLGSVTLIGDIEIMDKLALVQGWVSDEMRNEYYQTGFLGKYKGCNGLHLVNGYKKDGKTPVISVKKLFIVPSGYESPLKIVKKGEMLVQEIDDADTAHYEVILRQRFGAAVIYANTPMLGVYNDASA